MVQPAFRRKGIAVARLDPARAFFEQKGVRYFIVYMAIKNRGARAFYERSGLVPLDTTDWRDRKHF